MEEQKQTQTETITKTKTSVGIVNVAVITLLMGASLFVAAGIVMGLTNMKTMPSRRTPAIQPTNIVFMPKVINNARASIMNFNGQLDVYNRGVFAGSIVNADQWGSSGNIGVNELNPLSIEVHLIDNGSPVDVPSQVITMLTDNGKITDLCYPGGKDVYSGELKYYYDIYGAPYTDSALTIPVMKTKCPSLLANSYNPMDLTAGDVNTPYPDEIGPYIRSYIIREGVSIGAYLGSLYGFDMDLWDENYELIGGKSPLMVSIGHFAEGTQTIPERVWTIESVGPYNLNEDKVVFFGVHELCIPSVTIEPNTGAYFFYDLSGRPYADSLLTKPVACGVNPGDDDYEMQSLSQEEFESKVINEELPDMMVE